MRTYGWESAIKCEFNPEASMLMVSGSLNTDMTGRAKGEIMVFTIDKKLRICARISNRPSDATGCWYGNKFVISSEFKWLANLISTTMLLVNKVRSNFCKNDFLLSIYQFLYICNFQVSFALDKNANDHTLACVRVLYRFYNSAGNALRHLLVANLAKDLGPEVPDCQAGIKLLENLDPLVTQLLASENRSIVALRNVWFTLSNNVFSFNYFIY